MRGRLREAGPGTGTGGEPERGAARARRGGGPLVPGQGSVIPFSGPAGSSCLFRPREAWKEERRGCGAGGGCWQAEPRAPGSGRARGAAVRGCVVTLRAQSGFLITRVFPPKVLLRLL